MKLKFFDNGTVDMLELVKDIWGTQPGLEHSTTIEAFQLLMAHQRELDAQIVEKDWSAFASASPRFMRSVAQAIRQQDDEQEEERKR